MYPDFIIIGAMRGGTTSLYRYLIQHPNIAKQRHKEIHFFDKYYDRGWNWYQSIFEKNISDEEKSNKLILSGEATPSYICHPEARLRIAKDIPKVKLIVLLRNPIDRAYSQYQRAISKGKIKLTFDQEIKHQSEGFEDALEDIFNNAKFYATNAIKRFQFLSRGVYVLQLEKWFKLFNKNQFSFVKSEDFYQNPQKVCDTVFSFLGLSKHPIDTQKIWNKQTSQPMDPTTRKWLEDFFEPYNKKLYKLLNRDFGWDRKNL